MVGTEVLDSVNYETRSKAESDTIRIERAARKLTQCRKAFDERTCY
jgi:hypothetical protein